MANHERAVCLYVPRATLVHASILTQYRRINTPCDRPRQHYVRRYETVSLTAYEVIVRKIYRSRQLHIFHERISLQFPSYPAHDENFTGLNNSKFMQTHSVSRAPH